jgi:hypothetical protein
LLQQNIQFSASIGVTCILNMVPIPTPLFSTPISRCMTEKSGAESTALFSSSMISRAGGGHRYRVAQRYFFR